MMKKPSARETNSARTVTVFSSPLLLRITRCKSFF